MKLPTFGEAEEALKGLHTRGLEHVAEQAASTIHQVTRSLVARDSDPSSTCKPGNDSGVCQKPTTSGNTQTLAIILGSAIPLGCAVIVLIFLHRRHLKKQRLEEINDPHKSLDFGMDDHMPGKSKWAKQKEGIPEMTVTDVGGTPGRPRGLSMDLGSNPYLLPAEVNGSHGSIHSMSRSFHDEHDPYRPVTMARGDGDSIRSARPMNDKSSVYSAATSISNEKAGLIINARPMSRSMPKSADPMSPQGPQSPESLQSRQMHSTNRGMPSSRKASIGSSEQSLADIRQHTFSPPPPTEPENPTRPARTSSSSAGPTTRPARKSSAAAHPPPFVNRESSNYGDAVETMPAPPSQIKAAVSQFGIQPAIIKTSPESANTNTPAQPKLSVMGARPLPPDNPEDNPEQRANRIRSFYKEYFDDSKPAQHMDALREDDIDPSYLDDGAIYDPAAGGFVTAPKPWAQPMGRRAMTPPPRGAKSAPGSPHRGPHRRNLSAHSSGQPGAPRGRAPPMPKKRQPPPPPLQSLPTPSKLTGDMFINSPIDFAPTVTYRDRQAGRELDAQREYMPAVAVHSPLVTSYDELAAVPSPFMLRKSGTFTGLDFAPPPRFKNEGGGSDAGSIRSNRSGISAVQQNALRDGAYRVSRIPTEVVTTRDDLTNQLKPSWNLRD